MDHTQEQMAQMIQNLREDIKEIRTETRQDIKDLEGKTEIWHTEVRKEFSDVKKRLDTIETTISTKTEIKRFNYERMASWGAILLVVVSVFNLGYKLEMNHQETMAQVELNRKHMDSTAEQALHQVDRNK